ncbi:xre family transcriptional regulator, partial [Lasius niger]
MPQGKSVWEIGTDKDSRKKFRDDLKKRSEQKDPKKGFTGSLGYDPRETAFCFVTPQKFSNQPDEIQKSPYKDQWQEIKIYDADDLRSWLNKCPKTELWLAGEIGALPKEKIERLQDFYNTYAAISPATNKDERKILPPALLLAGREKYIKSFQDWLAKERSCKPYRLEAETAKEAAAFVYAALYLSDSFPLALSSLIMHSKEATEALSSKDSTANKNLLLILTSPDIDESLCQTLTNKGWKVVWAVDQRNSVNDTNHRLILPWRKDLEEGLKTAFPLQTAADYRWASITAAKAGRSINRLLSLLLKSQTKKQEEEKLTALLPAILAGGWVASHENGWANPDSEDREVIVQLSNSRKWIELDRIFNKEATEHRLDGKLIKIGERQGKISFHLRAPQAELTTLTGIFTEADG